MNRSFLILLMLFLIYSSMLIGQSCSSEFLVQRSIKAIETDSNIPWELHEHQVFINTACEQNGKLVIHLVGSFDNPKNTVYFPALAANNGFKVINLKYENGTAALSACTESEDVDCFKNFRQEIIFGNDVSSQVNVDEDNSIINRIEKLLTYLQSTYPAENWDEFLSDSGTIIWENILLSGHSQGGGHAAYLAKNYEVERALMFASPNDYSAHFSAPANWVSESSATPTSRYYAFGNLYDEIANFNNQFEVWTEMNLTTNSDSTNVDITECNYNDSQILYTRDETASGVAANHNSVILDKDTPLTGDIPLFTLVWEYMLGICSVIDNTENIEDWTTIDVYPNPTTSIIFIENDHIISTVELYDFNGKLLKTFHPNLKKFNLNLDDYYGMLMLKFTLENSRKSFCKLMLKY